MIAQIIAEAVKHHPRAFHAAAAVGAYLFLSLMCCFAACLFICASKVPEYPSQENP